MTSKTQAHLLKDLNLLVSTGLGVAPIAPALCSLLLKIMGADAGGMCWFDERGVPEGFYQSGSPREVEELFMNHYEELFVGLDEYTPFWYVGNKGLGVGNALLASKEYLRSNTYNLLIKPSHCHFLLDAAVEVDGTTRLTACFFRAKENPFTQADAEKLTALIPLLRGAIGKRLDALPSLTANAESGHMVIAENGQRVEMIDAPANQLLNTVQLFDQNISHSLSLSEPPRFVQLLCKQLVRNPGTGASVNFDLAGGTLVVLANWLNVAPSAVAEIANALSNRKILVSLQLRRCGAIQVVQGISALGLSPLQSRIAMYAAAGGSRTECASHHRVSKEALKKHLREIYAASRSTDWGELATTLRAAPALLM